MTQQKGLINKYVLQAIIASEEHLHPASVHFNMSGGGCMETKRKTGVGMGAGMVSRHCQELGPFIC